jgi:hypothetical protein
MGIAGNGKQGRKNKMKVKFDSTHTLSYGYIEDGERQYYSNTPGKEVGIYVFGPNESGYFTPQKVKAEVARILGRGIE